MNESIIRRVGLTKQTGKTDKRGKRIFYILMFIVFFWFIATQLLGNSEQSSGISQADYVYQGQILWEKPDGSSEPITVPGKYDVAENETMVYSAGCGMDDWRVQTAAAFGSECFCIVTAVLSYDYAWTAANYLLC